MYIYMYIFVGLIFLLKQIYQNIKNSQVCFQISEKYTKTQFNSEIDRLKD